MPKPAAMLNTTYNLHFGDNYGTHKSARAAAGHNIYSLKYTT
jgi:hypothetical protein